MFEFANNLFFKLIIFFFSMKNIISSRYRASRYGRYNIYLIKNIKFMECS